MLHEEQPNGRANAGCCKKNSRIGVRMLSAHRLSVTVARRGVALESKEFQEMLLLATARRFWRCCCWRLLGDSGDVVVGDCLEILEMLLLEIVCRFWRCCCWILLGDPGDAIVGDCVEIQASCAFFRDAFVRHYKESHACVHYCRLHGPRDAFVQDCMDIHSFRWNAKNLRLHSHHHLPCPYPIHHLALCH